MLLHFGDYIGLEAEIWWQILSSSFQNKNRLTKEARNNHGLRLKYNAIIYCYDTSLNTEMAQIVKNEEI